MISSCDNSDHKVEELWNDALFYHNNSNFSQCVVKLDLLAEKYPNSHYASQAYYLISEIYLNEYKEYDIAINLLNKIIDNYPNSAESKKSLFTLGYINANYIDSYSDANYFYVEFIKKYPDDDLVPSVEFELDNLKPLLIKTESLINNK